MRWVVLVVLSVLAGCDSGADGGSGDAQRGDRGAGDARPRDARVADARVADARVDDARVDDARMRDAESSDARVADAEASDARPADARAADAQPTDAQPTDASAADARPADAQVADARAPDAAVELDAGPADAQPADPDAAPLDPLLPVPAHLAQCPAGVAPATACQHLDNPRVSLAFPDRMFCDVFGFECGIRSTPFEGACGCGCIAELPECGCPRIVDVVCGEDGVTRLNPCEARLAQVNIAHRGPCDPEAWCTPLDAVNTGRPPFGCDDFRFGCGDDQEIRDGCGCGCLRAGVTCPDVFDPAVRYLSFVRNPPAASVVCRPGEFPFLGICGSGCAARTPDCPAADDRDVVVYQPNPQRCLGVELACPAGSTPFNDHCGCGCRTAPPAGCNCPDEDAPICGVRADGRAFTYRNPCRMACDGAVEDFGRCLPEPMPPPCGFGFAQVDGRCIRTCPGGDTCPDGQICRIINGMCLNDAACPDCAGCLGGCVDEP